MKRLIALVMVALPLMAYAQTNQINGSSSVRIETLAQSFMAQAPFTSYSEIVGDHAVYTGIAVQLFRAPQPLQLLNPWAPKAYGSSDQNLVLDPINKRPTGLKLFSVSF